jgi:hypothetical protein
MSASVLLFAPVLLLVAGCYADPHVAVHGVLSHAAGHHSVEKRQAVADLGPEKIQCLSNKVNEAFGDGSEEASRCQKAADDDFLGDNNALQATINDGFEIFCAPECGTVVLNAHKECGTFDMMSGATDFLVGLCATNKNGGKCYESYASTLGLFVTTEAPCYYSVFAGTQTCDTNCQSKLQSIATDQGCCMNVYHDFFASVANLNFTALYSTCKVDIPLNCNNSPLKSNTG